MTLGIPTLAPPTRAPHAWQQTHPATRPPPHTDPGGGGVGHAAGHDHLRPRKLHRQHQRFHGRQALHAGADGVGIVKGGQGPRLFHRSHHSYCVPRYIGVS